jgi:hypothetical protein
MARWKTRQLSNPLRGAVQDETSGFASLPDLAKALRLASIDLINFDACLMAMYAVRINASLTIWSSRADGAARDPYDTILGALTANRHVRRTL